jgi:hypothetical protein
VAPAIAKTDLHKSVGFLVSLQGSVLCAVEYLIQRYLVFRTATFLKASQFSLAGERTKARWAEDARLG